MIACWKSICEMKTWYAIYSYSLQVFKPVYIEHQYQQLIIEGYDYQYLAQVQKPLP